MGMLINYLLDPNTLFLLQLLSTATTINNVAAEFVEEENVHNKYHSVENCQKWCLINECEDNPEFMTENCKPQCDEWRSQIHGIDEIEDFYDLTARDINGNEIDFYEEFYE